jgi:hypothetical protein
MVLVIMKIDHLCRTETIRNNVQPQFLCTAINLRRGLVLGLA